MLDPHPIFVAGSWEVSEQRITTTTPGTGDVVGHCYHASAEQLERATVAAVAGFEQWRRSASYDRSAALEAIASGIEQRAELLSELLAREAGKPLADARVEVDRTAFTFRFAAQEALRMVGELVPLDVIPSSKGKWAITRRMPIGPVAGISPFNVPLSLAAHKLAPAIAAGDSIVLKPDSRVALTLMTLAEAIADAGLPAGVVSMLPMDVHVGDRLVTDQRFRLLSFTGSASVGWDMRARAGAKHVVLELGGDAAVIVADDADLDLVMERLLIGSFKYAGQICISVQRIIVHRSKLDELRGRLVAGASAMQVGPPLDSGVDMGPMISEAAAQRAVDLVDDAVGGGARVLTGGARSSAYMQATVLEGVAPDARLAREEAFAPIVLLLPFDTLDEAIDLVNHSDYGLQAGIFTRDLRSMWHAFERLDVGGVIVNDVPTYRVDHMPYGGVKQSGLGREGVRHAMEHMTELRTLVITPEK